MAINTTGNNGSIVGVTGVHPDNMGNTLVFKGTAYNVNVGDTLKVGANGLVDVKLSNASGNLLQKRGDGLYAELKGYSYQKIGDFEIRKYPDGTMIQTYTFVPPNQ